MPTVRVRAPELIAGDWFNSAAPLRLADLRGRFVLLDFWTFACANCLHVLAELRPFEAEFADVATVVGIHSPKFAHEAEAAALGAALERHEVRHPVLNDPALRLWQQYAVKAWPTLVLVDPEGYVVAQAAGEGQVEALAAMLRRSIPEYAARGTLRRGPAPEAGTAPPSGPLRFPAKAVLRPDTATLLVADAGHHSVLELAATTHDVLRRIGSGRRGRLDGPAERARFAEPNGVALLPPGRAPYDLLVADTANHVLRGVRLADGAVLATLDLPAALAGVETITGPVPHVLSPWDVAWWPALDRVVVAAAGVHLLLSVDLATGATAVLAGTTVEGLKDGPARDCWLAQPSGLAVDGDRLWFVDAETSALRFLTVGGTIETAVGEGLFDFGHVDGPAARARFQHPLGVTRLPDRSVAVHDTFNGAVRRYDPAARVVSTLASGLAEPSGGVLVDDELLVVESAAHRLTAVTALTAVTDAALVAGGAQRAQRPVMRVRSGVVELRVPFTPAPGRRIDARFGPATRLSVTASPPELLISGGGESTELVRRLELAPGAGVLQVTAQAASCDAGEEHPACYLARQDWGVPLEVGAGGAATVDLVLLD